MSHRKSDACLRINESSLFRTFLLLFKFLVSNRCIRGFSLRLPILIMPHNYNKNPRVAFSMLYIQTYTTASKTHFPEYLKFLHHLSYSSIKSICPLLLMIYCLQSWIVWKDWISASLFYGCTMPLPLCGAELFMITIVLPHNPSSHILEPK